MAQTLTADPARAEYMKTMGRQLGEHFYELWQELAWLNVKWSEYVELYGTKPSRVDLANKAAGLFFRIVQDTLWDEALLHLCRVTDPPKSVNHPTLAVRSLPDLVDKSIKKSISALADAANQKTKFARDWRNRKIAHIDRALALKQKAKPLAAASRKDVREALDAIAKVLNAVDEHYRGSTTSFAPLHGSATGAIQLLYVIDDGLKAAAERQDRIQRQVFRPQDLQPRNL